MFRYMRIAQQKRAAGLHFEGRKKHKPGNKPPKQYICKKNAKALAKDAIEKAHQGKAEAFILNKKKNL